MLNKRGLISKKMGFWVRFLVMSGSLTALQAAEPSQTQPNRQNPATSTLVPPKAEIDTNEAKARQAKEELSFLHALPAVYPAIKEKAMPKKELQIKVEGNDGQTKLYTISIVENEPAPSRLALSNARSNGDPGSNLEARRKRRAMRRKESGEVCCCCKNLVRYLDAKGAYTELGSAPAGGKVRIPPPANSSSAIESDERLTLTPEESNGLPSGDWLLSGEEGATLQSNLQQWCTQAGWKLLWNASTDYAIEAPATLNGNLVEVVHGLIDRYKDAEIPLKSSIYINQRLVVVSLY